ncbi:MAG: phospholipase D family protein [Algibacter sp.]|uniref:phospholipase D family protein n=1 Tax=Algibacter sp. TaxID=1872428 RepID=UPI00329A1C90
MNGFLKLKYYLLAVVMALTACNTKNTEIPETDFCSKIHRNDSISLSKSLEEFNPLIQNKTGVYVLEDGSGSMVARAWLTEYAEKTIDIQYFIFSTDNVGLIACDYLIKAADRGVHIRVLVDDIMVEADAQDILTFNSHKNISVKIYNPGVNLGKNIFQKIGKFTTDFKAANQRMHNKTFIVDDKVVITGGRNIADEYFDYDHEYNFRDRDILLIGKETKAVKTSFETFWNNKLSIDVTQVIKDIPKNILEDDRFDKLHEYACNPENFWPQVRTRIENLPETFNTIKNSGELVWLDQVSFISDLPGKNDGENGLSGGGISTSALINLVKNAKSSIDIQTPYLITTKASRKLFKDAVNRGVNIRILTNSLASTDNLEAFSGYQSNRNDLLKTGVRIFEFKPDAEERKKIMTGELQSTLDYTPIFGLHAKSMVIDGNTTVIGTFNLDPRSANLNTECIVVVKSKKISEGVLIGMNIEFNPENSWETTLDYNPDSEVSNYKRLKTWTRKVIPNSIL